MPMLSRLANHVRPKSSRRSVLFVVAGMVFFFVLFDGILSYLVPLVITSHGFSAMQMGFIISTSSLAGMLFDFLLSLFAAHTYYRRMFFWMLLLGASFPLFLFSGNTVGMYLFAMAAWGFYYDFYQIGAMDFVGRTTPGTEHVSSYGVLKVFDGFGYLIAPLLASTVLAYSGTTAILHSLLWMFFAVAVLFFIILIVTDREDTVGAARHRMVLPLSTLGEFSLWKRIGTVIAPILVFTLAINIVDATFWTIGPLISESLARADGVPFMGGLFMVAYTFPPLFVGWFIGRFTSRFGKERTAFTALGAGSLILTTIPFAVAPAAILGICFVSATCFAFTWPAINGAYADRVAGALHIEKEIATLQNAATNVGFIVGPALAGIASGALGYTTTFSILGLLGIVVAVTLVFVTPRSMNLSRIPRSIRGGI